MDFRSDNTAPATPECLEAIVEAASRSATSYGGDAWSRRLDAAFADWFEADVAVVPLASGTAGNALALAQSVPPFGAILCHEQAHIHEHECGATEHQTGGAKLLLLPGDGAKIDPDRLAAALDTGDDPAADHRVVASALSLTQATERGTLYRPDEIAALTEIAQGHGLVVHMDGARFANALVALDRAPADLTWRAGVDVLVYGATKNGALAAEAVIFFDPAKAERFRLRRTRAGHSLSKMRFVSAQLLAGLENDRVRHWAGHANAMARRLADGLATVPGCRAQDAVEVNMLWTTLPDGAAARLESAGFAIEHWQENGTTATRLVCSWATRPEDVDHLIAVVAG